MVVGGIIAIGLFVVGFLMGHFLTQRAWIITLERKDKKDGS